MADTITPLVTRVGRRLRAQRGLEAGAKVALWTLLVAVPLLLLLKLVDRPVGAGAALALGALPLLGILWGALTASSPLAAAQRIDRSHGTHDLMASALGFAGLQPAEQTAFMRACIAQAERLAPTIDVRRAAQLAAPRGWPLLLGLVALLAGVWHVQLAAPAQPLAPVAPRLQPPALAASEDLEAFADELRALSAKDDESELLRQAARDADALIERLATRSIDRIEALQELRRIEAGLRDGLGVDADALKQALAELGQALGRAPVTDSLAEALREGEAGTAQAELTKLSSRVRSEELRAAEQKSLQQAMQRAATPPANERREQADRAREELDRLLKKRSEQQAAGEPPPPPSLLEKKRRELDRLERDAERAEQRKRELDRLRRELDQAAQDMAAQRSQDGAGAMDRAAQELQRMAQQAESQARGSQMSRTLAQLREAIERAGQRGQQGPRGQQGQQGQEGRGQRQAAGQGQGQGQSGEGEQGGGEQGQPLSLRRFSKSASGEQSGAGPEGGEPGKPGAPGEQPGLMPGGLSPAENAEGEALLLEQPGQGAGHGGAPGQEPEARRLAAEHADSQLAGAQGRGPTRSEVIREASAHGFASREYEKVHGDYRQHAESVLERDEIPGGYRYYVRRYFQLIRPRETGQ